MAAQLTYLDVKNRLDKEGYCLISIERVGNVLHRIKYKCPHNHIKEVSWKNWLMGRRCSKCANMNRIGKKINSLPRLTIEDIDNRLKTVGYTLLETIYNGNCLSHIKYKCPNGHEKTVTWKNWIQGRRCKLCRLRNYAKSRRLGIEFIREELLKENYVLLSNTYINSKTKFKYKCPLGHIGAIIWTNWLKGQRCSKCAVINFSGYNHPNWKGGISCEPYCDVWLDKEFKESIKARDNYKCQNPGCWKTSNRLAIHHIDYNKKNCGPTNLITVCNSCNSRANHNRGYWSEVYSNLLKKRIKLL